VLEEIRIRGLGVIDDAVLELSPGLTVVSGETGAGKTMIVQGLNLLGGGRADYGRLAPGVARAFVEGRLTVPADGELAARVRDAGADLDDGDLIVGRTLSTDGRSRAQLGGRSVPASTLGEIVGALVTVHGQSDQQRLMRPAEQRLALDRFAGDAVSVPLAAYQDVYRRLGAVRGRLAELTDRARERTQEAELLRLSLAEVERVAPTSGEDTALDAELNRLDHAEALVRAANSAYGALVSDVALGEGSPGAADLVSVAGRMIASESDLDPELSQLGDRLGEIGLLLADVAADLASYAAGIESDPARLAAAQERKADLTALARAHNTDIDGVLAWADRAGRRLLELDSDGDAIGALRAEHDRLRDEVADLVATISKARQAAAEQFGRAVAVELAGLAMPRATVEAALSRRDDPNGIPLEGRTVAFGPAGVDDVEIRLIPHPGAPPRAVQKGASGGELSRVMLAIEVVLAANDTGSTMVFDEVDAGVGGRAAVEVGRRLARLARSHQVICITHLPQVAAFADRHLVVSKTDDGLVTRSGVTMLDGAGRVRELSRMLSGQEESSLARGHAEELIASAEVDKAAFGVSID
jgi:DNA repair protein RecN (Recombination protein N)